MKDILNDLYQHKRLTQSQAKEVLINIAAEKYNDAHLASFMTVFMMRPITVDELSGFRNALKELAIKVDFSDYNTIDIVGTGGDGKDTFNISTLTSFIVAGTGQKVAKHGNYSVSSQSGSSDMLASFGYEFTNDENILKEHLEKANISYHEPCTLQHGQKLAGLVNSILQQLGYTPAPVKDSHLCCGSAGTYSIFQPELSKQLKVNKLNNLLASTPEMIVTANIGCLMHLQKDNKIPVKHWVELLDNQPN